MRCCVVELICCRLFVVESIWHEHRQAITSIAHEAAEGVRANIVRPMKLDATHEMMEVAGHRARLIRQRHREEKQATFLCTRRVFILWKETSTLVSGHQQLTHISLLTPGPLCFKCVFAGETMLTKTSGEQV